MNLEDMLLRGGGNFISQSDLYNVYKDVSNRIDSVNDNMHKYASGGGMMNAAGPSS